MLIGLARTRGPASCDGRLKTNSVCIVPVLWIGNFKNRGEKEEKCTVFVAALGDFVVRARPAEHFSTTASGSKASQFQRRALLVPSRERRLLVLSATQLEA